MNRPLILLVTIALAAPTVAQRGGGRGGSGDVWKYLAAKYDKNKDGKITAAEYQGDLQREERKFKGYDGNGDGAITKDDFAGGSGRRRGSGGRRGGGGRGGPRGGTPTSIVGPAIAEALANNADTDSDSRVTLTEWNKTLATLDGNQDAIVDADELNGIMCAALGRKVLSARAIGRRAKHLDTNKDGVVQLTELGAMFAKMDKNADKVLSAVEIGAMRPVVPNQPKVGDVAPDFALPLVKNPKVLVRLSSFKGTRPVALIFGSYT